MSTSRPSREERLAALREYFNKKSATTTTQSAPSTTQSSPEIIRDTHARLRSVLETHQQHLNQYNPLVQRVKDCQIQLAYQQIAEEAPGQEIPPATELAP